MIQVCSRCGTRWNVRDRQRVWCPRCNGTLLAPAVSAASSTPSAPPTSDARWAAHGAAARPQQAPRSPKLPAGYRWIAVRPGSGPPPRRAARPLGPTPRYAEVPRWGLQQPFEVEGPTTTTQTGGPAPTLVRGLIIATMALYGVAALSYLVRYALMLVNRTVLIDPILDAVVTWGAVAVSVLALFALIGMAVVLANWLVARREAAYARFEKPDTRSKTEILAGCLVPVANLFFAPVLVFELAMVEARMRDLRTRIVVWWCLWVVSFFLSGYAAIAGLPFVARDAQSIADSNLTTAIAYLFALAALASLYKVFAGFERSGVTESVKRWVVVRADGSPQSPRADTESAIPVESERRDPAA